MKNPKHSFIIFIASLKSVLLFSFSLWKFIYISLTLLFLFKIVQAIIPSIQILITKELVDSINNTYQGESPMKAFTYLGFQAGITIINQIMETLEKLNSARMQLKANYIVEEKMVLKTSKLPLAVFDNNSFYDLLLRASSGQSQRVIEMISGPLMIIQSIITLVMLLIVIAKFHFLAVVIVILMSIPPVIINLYISKARYKLMKELTPQVRLSNYLLNILKSRNTAKEVRLFQLQDYLISKWKNIFFSIGQKNLTFDVRSNLIRSVIENSISIISAAILAFFIWMIAKQKLSIGDYIAISQAYVSTQAAMLSLALSISEVYGNILSLNDVVKFLKLSVPNETNTNYGTRKFPILRRKGITVENLSFSYHEDGPSVLKNISFSILPGQKVAIVGENGSGKSTLIKCLLGLYRSYQGNIFYEDIELRQISSEELHRHVSAVLQDYVKYDLTIIDNIGFGNVGEIENKDAIITAAKKGGAHAFIENLEKGYNTEVGSAFYGGVELSGGQWQKIAISRAFFKNADIVILDEPSASLDPFSEASLFDKYTELSEGKVTILISHRLNTCVNADLILVMKKGKIIEKGTHEELMALNGEYAEMFYLQSKEYSNNSVKAF